MLIGNIENGIDSEEESTNIFFKYVLYLKLSFAGKLVSRLILLIRIHTTQRIRSNTGKERHTFLMPKSPMEIRKKTWLM